MNELPRDAASRQRLLALRRQRKMARSPYGFLRGDIAAFYSHLGDLGRPLPQGPRIWICGDCHFGNLGPLSDGAGAVQVQLRDLDQAVIGNPAVDLVRLALSLASVISGDRSGARILGVVAAVLDGYALGLASNEVAEAEPPSVRAVRRHAVARRWRHTARERIGDPTPGIMLGKRFWPLLPRERRDLEQLVAAPAFAADLVGEAARQGLELIDAAYRVKGCNSLGGLRFALTVRCGPRLHLLDVKEAARPLVSPLRADGVPDGEAERVVAGARALSPHLGLRMSAAEVAGGPVFTRVLSPKDLKFGADLMAGKEAVDIARHLGAVVGRSHGAQLSDGDRRAWAEVVASGASEETHWLFEAVGRLLGCVEADYLRHCRPTLAAEADGHRGQATLGG